MKLPHVANLELMFSIFLVSESELEMKHPELSLHEPMMMEEDALPVELREPTTPPRACHRKVCIEYCNLKHLKMYDSNATIACLEF